MSKTPRGVRMINENVVQPGRALIVTTEDFDDYNWEDLPDGTLHVDTETGNISVKLKGETTWSPTGLKDDGTLVISRDTQFCDEIFIITEINAENNTFIYTSNNEQRYKTFDVNGFVFELEKGTYLPGRNHLEVTIDDCLVRTVMNGGIEELSESKFRVTEQLIVGQKVAVRYVKWSKIGNPYPRFYLNETEPEAPEYGDFWLSEDDIDIPVSDEDILSGNDISWDKIVGTPTTITGYGITDPVEMRGHVHRALDITDFPSSLPANGGDADTVKGRKPGDAAGDLATINDAGYLNNNVINPTFLFDLGLIYIQNERPSVPRNNAIWFCTSSSNPHIEVYSNYQWISMN